MSDGTATLTGARHNTDSDGDVAIEAHGLTKAYGATPVLHGVDLRVDRGSVYALLGPNGAGKTTIVRILATLTAADSGTASIVGFDIGRDRRSVRRCISLTGQYAALDELQTGEENLRMMGRLQGFGARAALRRATELLEQFDLHDAARRRVGTYSGGMRRRLDLAAGLVAAPEVIFLDEPTTGLDPRSRQAMWNVVTDLAASGVTVLLTTQYLDEADQLADRIAVLDAGRIVAEGTAEELKRRVSAHRLDVTFADETAFRSAVAEAGDRVVDVRAADRRLGITTSGGAADVRHQLDELDPDHSVITAFAVHTATLDEVFMSFTGRHATATDAAAPAASTNNTPTPTRTNTNTNTTPTGTSAATAAEESLHV